MPRYGSTRLKLTLEPVSGKAIPVRRGEVMRIRQTLGEQCVDFNSFNLDDYKEYMDVSSGRSTTGFRPRKGNILFSNPPRFRPMIGILEMSPGCVTDILGRTCHAVLFEARDGFAAHVTVGQVMDHPAPRRSVQRALDELREDFRRLTRVRPQRVSFVHH